jgi:hypothetical protein
MAAQPKEINKNEISKKSIDAKAEYVHDGHI